MNKSQKYNQAKPVVLLKNSFGNNKRKNGAGDGTRTRDRLITNQLLYQLSYASSYSTVARAGILFTLEIKCNYFFNFCGDFFSFFAHAKE